MNPTKSGEKGSYEAAREEIAIEHTCSVTNFTRKTFLEFIELGNKSLTYQAVKFGADWSRAYHDQKFQALKEHCEKLAAALKKIGVDDDINTRFSKSEHEGAYYINVAKDALESHKQFMQQIEAK